MRPRLSTPIDAWSKGPEEFLEALRRRNFSDLKIEGAPSAWASLRQPKAARSEAPSVSDYAYVAEDATKVAPGWGLLIAPAKLADALRDKTKLLIVSSHADAALDLLLHSVAAREWTPTAAEPAMNLDTFKHQDVSIEPGALIGPGTEIGAGTVIECGVRLGARVRIGKNCRIGANSRLADDTVVGDDCRFTANVSIGGQGFGFVKYPDEKTRRPRLHVGRAVVGNGVRLGAFDAIDRGVFDDTVVADGNSLDNIVQIAHNCQVGENGILCSFVGLSGSTRIGDRVTIAGMVGTKDHVRIGHDVTIAAQSGVSCDIRDGEIVKGYPPIPLKESLRLQVLQGKLPELFSRVRKLEEDQEP